MDNDEYSDAQPWLVYGVVKGLSPLCAEKHFREYIELQAARLSRSLRPFWDLTREELEDALSVYHSECELLAGQATQALRVLLERVFQLCSLQEEVWKSLKCRLSFLYWFGQAEDWIKFHLNSLFCLATRQDLPLAPSLCEWGPTHLPGIFLGGAGYRALRRLSRLGLCTATASLLLAKKGMPAMQAWKVKKALDKHREALTTKLPSLELRDLVEQVHRTVDEVFPPATKHGKWERFVPEILQPFRIPSCSGHVETSRDDHGAYGFIQDRLPSFFVQGEDIDLLIGKLYDLPEDTPGHNVVRRDGICSWDLLPGNGYEWDGAGNELASILDASLPINRGRTQELSLGLLQYLWAEVRDEGPHSCRAVAIPEPLKVRVVTGGPEIEYYVASYIQKLVHSQLRQHRCFQLIGRPLERQDIEFVLSGMRPGYVLNSADYKAATDGLEPVLSVACATRIGENMGFSRRACELFRSTLVNHSISYEPLKSNEKFFHRQTMGQLMGSPTSFPILCLVNAAVTRHSLELATGRRYSLLETHMLVNGDDLLYPTPPDAIPIWERQTRRCGLEKSPGKSYVSASFCTLNSELWQVRQEVDYFGSPYWTSDSCPLVNLGLLLGTNVKKGHGLSVLAPSDTFRFQDISQMANDLVEGHDALLKEKLMTIFLESWRQVLTKVPPGVSWWIPKCLGGLGLPWTRGYDPDLSKQQLKIATWFSSGCSVKEHLRRKTLLQEKVGFASVWEEASKFLNRAILEVGLPGVQFTDQVSEVSVADWLAPVVVSLYFDGFRPEKVELDRSKLLWRNWNRVWKRGTAHGMQSLTWDVIQSYQGKQVEIFLPRPPPYWEIKGDALSRKSVGP